MMRFIIWAMGVAACVWVIDKLGYWRDIAAFAVFASFVLWTVGMGVWAKRGMRVGPPRRRATDLTPADIQTALARLNQERAAREGRPR